MPETILFLQVGWGWGDIKLAVIYTWLPWFQRLFLIFLRVRKNEHLPASFATRSRRFARFQQLTNLSVIMPETVPPPPPICFLHPHNCEMDAAFLEPFSSHYRSVVHSAGIVEFRLY